MNAFWWVSVLFNTESFLCVFVVLVGHEMLIQVVARGDFENHKAPKPVSGRHNGEVL